MGSAAFRRGVVRIYRFKAEKLEAILGQYGHLVGSSRGAVTSSGAELIEGLDSEPVDVSVSARSVFVFLGSLNSLLGCQVFKESLFNKSFLQSLMSSLQSPIPLHLSLRAHLNEGNTFLLEAVGAVGTQHGPAHPPAE